VAAAIKQQIAEGVETFFQDFNEKPGLTVVVVGDDPASAAYVRNKAKTATDLGFRSTKLALNATTSQEKLVSVIEELNKDDSVDGILVQLPLPEHINEAEIIELITPQKDVDGFHPMNSGRLSAGANQDVLAPCTPAGCIVLAKSALGEDLSGLHVVIIGRSNIVGKPAAQLFLAENCTVTIAHSRTRGIEAVAKQADILLVAVGRPEMVKEHWVKPGACVIDVGINRVGAPERGQGKSKLVGDVDYESVAKVAGSITPVPGGVGPMTIAMLMSNTLRAARARRLNSSGD